MLLLLLQEPPSISPQTLRTVQYHAGLHAQPDGLSCVIFTRLSHCPASRVCRCSSCLLPVYISCLSVLLHSVQLLAVSEMPLCCHIFRPQLMLRTSDFSVSDLFSEMVYCVPRPCHESSVHQGLAMS